MSFNINQAIARNSYWSHHLGWDMYYPQILRLFHTAPQNTQQFAIAVAQWQHFHRPGLEVDGIIGPTTWNIIRQDIGITTTPSVGSSQGDGRASEHHTIVVRGHTVDFYVYVNVPNSREKIRQLTRFFMRLPDQHLALLYPIFIMKKKPGGRRGGGTWRPGEVPGSFTRTPHAQNTGIPSDDIKRLVVNQGKGLIGLSKDRWERPMGRLSFTVFHEIGHCVDYSFQPNGLVPPGARHTDYAGMETNRCGAGNRMVRRAVEAYARYICSPSRIYHTVPPSESNAQVNRRLISTLRRSPAFHSVPTAWQP